MEKIDLFEVYRKTLINGGHTVKPNGRYLVGLRKYGKKVDVKDFKTGDLADYLANTLPDILGATLGTWLNKDKVYLDTSLAYNSLDDAIAKAKKENQLAIFDIEEGKEIFIK